MPSDPPLTDAEICRKFTMTAKDPHFAAAKALSHARHDRIICEVPDCQCPHCCHEFTATWFDLTADNPEPHMSLGCEACNRWIYIEHIDQEGDEGFDPEHIMVTFNTDPEPS